MSTPLSTLCCCSCRFSSKKAAALAIVGVHGTEVGGHTVKCSWGKESSEPGQGPYQSGGPQLMQGANGQQAAVSIVNAAAEQPTYATLNIALRTNLPFFSRLR